MQRLLLFFLLLHLTACTSDDSALPAVSQATVDTDNESDFENILLELKLTTIDPMTQDTFYVLSDSLYDISVDINGTHWGTFRQYTGPVDPAAPGVQEVNGFLAQQEAFSYYLVLEYLTVPGNLQTAGEVADFLQGFLLVGDYFFTLKELKINDLSNTPHTLEMNETKVMSVPEKTKSVFVGTFNLKI